MSARPSFLVAWALVIAACGASSSRDGDAGPKAMFHGGPARLGVLETTGLDTYGGLQWVVETGGPVRSSPVVAGSLLYVGSSDSRLYAIDRLTGHARWTFEADGPVDSSPAVAAGRVVFASRTGTVFAVDAGTGELQWRRRTGPPLPLAWGYESGDYYTSSPAVVDDAVVFGAGDGRIYAVGLADGAILWTHQTGGRVRSSPAIADSVVYAGSMDGRVYALRLSDGSLVWRFETLGASLDSGRFGFDRRTIQSSPAVAGGTVYVGARDGFLYAIDAVDGRLAWRVDHEVSWIITTPAVADDVVYAASSDARFIQAVDARTGAERWRVGTERPVWPSPVVVEDGLYVATGGGVVLALDRATGVERWRFQTIDGIHSSPTVEDGILYVGDNGGRIYGLRGGGLPLRRAVFWDAELADRAERPGGEELRDFLVARGYARLDADSLAAFLSQRVADREPSVVVFAMDVLPAAVAPAPIDTSLLRRYLDAGGKVVWPGMPPFLWPRDPETGERDYADIDRRAPVALLGVGHEGASFDRYGAEPTPEGRRWGLTRGWLSAWAADSGNGLTLLAVDENGRAPAWVQSYGGPRGTGFVRYDGPTDDDHDRAVVALLAEILPRSPDEAAP